MIVAVIDIGTNSTKLAVISEKKTLVDTMTVTRIGEGLFSTGKINEKAASRTLKCVKDYIKLSKRFKSNEIIVVATEALRRASNGKTFIERVEKLGVKAKIISAKTESRLAYLGATSGLGKEKIIAIDLGGGSTEIIKGANNNISWAKSIPLGVVKLTEKFISNYPPQERELELLRNFVSKSISFIKPSRLPLVAIGGTAAAVAFISMKDKKFKPNRYHGMTLSQNTLRKLISRLKKLTVKEIITKLRLEPGRADVMLSGLILLDEIMTGVGTKSFIVSTHGLRQGVAHNYLMHKHLL